MSMPATAYGAYRNAYVNDAIETASPQRLLCMLYDRLVLDLMRARTRPARRAIGVRRPRASARTEARGPRS